MEWYQILFGVIVGLLLLTILIIIHELGHAFAARRNGVEVEEFGIGFPPRAKILGRNKGTLITLNWLLPIGGFCKMKGEDGASNEEGSFGAASYFGKTKILFAGALANLLAAFVIFSVLAVVGLPKIIPDQFVMPGDTTIVSSPVTVVAVNSGSPAAEDDIRPGDEIISLAGEPLKQAYQLSERTAEHRGETVTIELRREGEVLVKEVALLNQANGGYLGVSAGQSEHTRSTWSAPIVGVVVSGQFAWTTLQSLGNLVVNFVSGLVGSVSPDSDTREAASANLSSAGDSVSGPVGILGVIFPNAMMAGVTQLAFITGIISLTLAIMNILPIPGLDGGRWLLMTIFKIIRRPLSKDLEATINGIGMLVLFGLIILITIADIFKIWG